MDLLFAERRFSGGYIQSGRIHRSWNVRNLPRVPADAAADAVQVALRLQPAGFRPGHPRLLPHPQRRCRKPQDLSTVR